MMGKGVVRTGRTPTLAQSGSRTQGLGPLSLGLEWGEQPGWGLYFGVLWWGCQRWGCRVSLVQVSGHMCE